jgi:hypothetical protein
LEVAILINGLSVRHATVFRPLPPLACAGLDQFALKLGKAAEHS